MIFQLTKFLNVGSAVNQDIQMKIIDRCVDSCSRFHTEIYNQELYATVCKSAWIDVLHDCLNTIASWYASKALHC